MDLRSGLYIASGEARRHVELLPDHISALSDDLLLVILARLRCVATAARTSVLARRWRHLWAQLPALVFPDVPVLSVMTALDALLDSPAAAEGEVFLLDIRLPRATSRVTELLRDAALFQPEELLLTVPSEARSLCEPVDLPRFSRTTAISLCNRNGKRPAGLRVPPALDGKCLFPSLTTLVLSGYYPDDGLTALLPHCPRLHVLWYTVPGYRPCRQDYALTIHSATLRELVVEEGARVRRVDVAAPMLNQLTVSCLDGGDLTTVSIVAPVAEKVSWRCCHSKCWSTGFGRWYLKTVSLTTPASSAAPAAEAKTRRRPWLLRIDALRRQSSGAWIADRFEKQVENHLQLQVAADLSAMDLELHLTSMGHVYGALVSHLLGMRRICNVVRRLKLALIIPEGYRGRRECKRVTCVCEPTEWRSQTVSLTELEEVEIDGFQGEDHEFDFLELISRCAPMLKRVAVKPLEDASYGARIQGAFKEHPSVECCVLSSE